MDETRATRSPRTFYSTPILGSRPFPPLRLLFISHSFPPRDRSLANLGGMQRVATEMHAALAREKSIQLSSVVLRSSSRWNAACTALFFPRVYRTIVRMAERREIDTVFFSSLVTGSLTPVVHRCLRNHGIRTCSIAHGDDVILPFRPYQNHLRRVFGTLDAVLPVSRATAQACIDRGAASDKVIVIPNGIEPRRFSLDDDASQRPRQSTAALPMPTSYNLPDDALLLCSTGRQVARKGFAWFVEQVMPLVPQNVHYWLIGNGPQTRTIRSAIAKNRLENRVCLLGNVTDRDVKRIYRLADLFVMPNIRQPGTMEGFGVVLLEAGLCGLPALGARLEGIEDVIVEGQNGNLIESGDARAFAAAIQEYNQNRPALRKLARRTVPQAQQYAWDVIIQDHLKVIHELLEA